MENQPLHAILANGDSMAQTRQNSTANTIRAMAAECRVTYVRTNSDALAHHITRLSGDDVEFDEIEQLLIALQRAGRVSRTELIQLQASYLHEAKP
jgi:hypothetical protein